MKKRVTDPPQPMLAYDSAEAWLDSPMAFTGADSRLGVDSGGVPMEIPWRALEYLAHREACPYCRNRLARRVAASSGRNAIAVDSNYLLLSCGFCGYWQFVGHHDNEFPVGPYRLAFMGKARSFGDSMPDELDAEVASYLRRNKDAWSRVDPLQLEKYVQAILRAHNPDLEVTHVGRSHDGGVDLMLLRDSVVETMVQVKRRSTGRGESVTTVRNLLGVMYHDRSLRGIVVSTANHFSRAALYETGRANASGRDGSVVELVDRGKLTELLSPLIPEKPWARLKQSGDAFAVPAGSAAIWRKLEEAANR